MKAVHVIMSDDTHKLLADLCHKYGVNQHTVVTQLIEFVYAQTQNEFGDYISNQEK